jgi:hypothetical protein
MRTGAALKASNLQFESSGITQPFRCAVSLHSHTLHSRESLDFIYRYAKRVGLIRAVIERGENKYRAIHASELDLSRAWWTPPIVPHDAWMLERDQIEGRLGLRAMVSLTDHDDIEAALALRVLEECRDAPISVEWTVPYRNTFFHLGLHNLRPDSAREEMCRLAAFTTNPTTTAFRPMLERVASCDGSLIVFNHPCWDESGIGEREHRAIACDFLGKHGPFVHALELNGLRPWSENQAVMKMAKRFAKPLISGGDRHAFEPNTILNLTNAANFAEFAGEVRAGLSTVLVTDQYREPFALRILQNLEAVLGDQENHGRGWRRWSDRVFFRCDDGVTRPLTELFGEKHPAAVAVFVGVVGALRHPSMKWAFRQVFYKREELTL